MEWGISPLCDTGCHFRVPPEHCSRRLGGPQLCPQALDERNAANVIVLLRQVVLYLQALLSTVLEGTMNDFAKLGNARPPLHPKSSPITQDYSISDHVLGLGINGKVVQCHDKARGSKFALKKSYTPPAIAFLVGPVPSLHASGKKLCRVLRAEAWRQVRH
ncbi:hypothetical protein V5799_024902 [Amblyomma americanum]|uniref:Uncharacterized protein n=1 Tax=Amblyomma americanum TaxID=6943 RepID=A0AAQ4EB47_AMBAM